MERLHQVERGFAEAQVVDRGPQVDHVALLPAAGVEAVEHVLVEVHAERRAAAVAAMDRAGAAPLRSAAPQFGRQAGSEKGVGARKEERERG